MMNNLEEEEAPLILGLPRESLECILGWLEPKDACTAARVCRAFRDALEAPLVWENIARREVPWMTASAAPRLAQELRPDSPLDLFDARAPRGGRYNHWKEFLRRRHAFADPKMIGQWMFPPWLDDGRGDWRTLADYAEKSAGELMVPCISRHQAKGSLISSPQFLAPFQVLAYRENMPEEEEGDDHEDVDLSDFFGVPSARMSHTTEVVKLRWAEIWGSIEASQALKRRCPHGPPADDGPEKILIIAGHLTTTLRYDDIFVFDPQTLEFARLNIQNGKVPNFARHASAVLEGQRKIACFGGFNGVDHMYGLAMLDLDTLGWSYPKTFGDPCRDNRKPKPRTNHAMARIGQELFIFGGNVTENSSEQETEDGRKTTTQDLDKDYRVLRDFWKLDLRSMTWTDLTPQEVDDDVPGPRSSHRMISCDDRILLFGGGQWTPLPSSNWVHKYNTIHEYSVSRGTWRRVPFRFAPGFEGDPEKPLDSRVDVSTFSLDCLVGQFWLHFGGQSLTTNECTNRLYSFDTIAMEWRCHGNKDFPRIRDVGAASAVNNDVFFFAGSAGEPIEDVDILRVWPELVL